jgi:Fe(3+) dicitrate transport protein
MKPNSPLFLSFAHVARPTALALAAGVLILAHRTANAQESAAPVATVASNAVDLAPITVIGEAAKIPQIAGSAAVIETQQIQRQNYSNPNRVLQQVPGVYVREEDGFGNFPNISLRGADGGRSTKVTIMEDGVMMAPAPYSEPAAYYTPRVGRMSGIEVLKGSSQVQYGPHTTGGVVNYLATPFLDLPELAPQEPVAEGGKGAKAVTAVSPESGVLVADDFYLRSTFGSFNTWLNHAWWGHTQKTDAGVFGVVLELFHNQSEGFRTIDKVGGNTGFTTIEPMVRLFWEPDTLLKQRIEFRFGYSRFDGDETYTGLTDPDLAADPFRRYVSTQFDNMTSDQFRYSLTHTMQPTDAIRVETTAYYTSFDREWYRLGDVRETKDKELSISSALAGAQPGLDILRGDAEGFWRYRANNRSYYTMGVQTRLDWEFETGELAHDLSIGARLHYDQAVRLQREDFYRVNGAGSVLGLSRGATGSGGNRFGETLAYSMFVEDSIKLGKLTVKPGIRWEHLEMEYQDKDESGANPDRILDSASGGLDAFAPGVGLVYELSNEWSVFGGYYRGISTPGPREFLRSGNDLEQSNGYELGVRRYGAALQAELVGFYTDFDNLLVRELQGASGTLGDENGGAATVYGVEAAVRYDLLHASGSDWRMPVRASATFTSAETDSDTASANAESIFSGGKAGNKLPYIPEWAASAGLGVEYRGLGLYLDATYTGEMFGTASNSSNLRTPSGKPDARYGMTDQFLVVDLSLQYQVSENIRLLAGISNLTDDIGVTSRLPFGARSNAPRSYYGGVEIRF